MKHAHIVANERAEHQQSFGSAFGEGLRRHGWRVTTSREAAPADLVCIWGVRRVPEVRCKVRCGEICILERGYLGDRFAWTSVSFGGGLNGHGVFRGPFDDGSRWEKHFAQLMQPWRLSDDGYALIMGQVPGDNSIRGVDIDAFYARARQAYAARGWQARFRPHPRWHPRDGEKIKAAALRSLQADLAGARCVVTWNSNSGVDAVLAGVPTVAMEQGSMAWDVTGHDLGKVPPTPDRTARAHALAWKQWSLDEMRAGDCWAAVRSW